MSQTPDRARFARLAILVSASVAALMGACASLPSVTYSGDSDSGVDAGKGGPADPHLPDATAVVKDGDDDATVIAANDSGPPGLDTDVDGGDDLGPIPGLMCGDAGVGSCEHCPGLPVVCKAASGNTCVANCGACMVGGLPCWRCPPNGKTRGICMAPKANGVLNCSGTNQCSCTTAADCPSVTGAADVCGAGTASAGACLTCGESGTNGQACALPDASSGTCHAGGSAAPSCE